MLTPQEARRLFEILENLRRDGKSIVFISHKLDEVFRVCDTVTILRDGRRIDSAFVKDIEVEWIIERMVGHAQLTIEKKP